MCDSCFNSEIKSFETYKDFEEFDFILIKKIFNEKTIKQIEFIKTSEIQIDPRDYEDVGYNVYECLKCEQLWGLHEPDQADRGFFIRLTHDQILKDQQKNK